MPTLDPVEEFRAFKKNSRWYAEHWLRSGTRHEAEHFIITARLDAWCQRVGEAGPAGRAKLLAEISPEGTA
jgi:hypothetical protein